MTEPKEGELVCPPYMRMGAMFEIRWMRMERRDGLGLSDELSACTFAPKGEWSAAPVDPALLHRRDDK